MLGRIVSKAPTIVTLSEVESSSQIMDCLVRALAAGKLIVAPTETRYGLLARADDRRTVASISHAKKRDSDKAIAVFVPDVPSLDRYAMVTAAGRLLAEHFLPGPLTLVLKAVVDLPAPVVNDELIGLRVSSHPLICRLVRRVGVPLTATSANISGAGAGSALEAAAQFESQVAVCIDGGPLIGPASTVVDASRTPVRIQREGAISVASIEAVLRQVPNE